MTPPTLPGSDISFQLPPETTRLVLRHQRVTGFRWWGLVELPLLLLGLLLVVPILLALHFLAGGDGSLGGDGGDDSGRSFTRRFSYFWHDLKLEVLNFHGDVLATYRHRATSREDGERFVTAALSAAEARGLVLTEVIQAENKEVAEVWYGGQPLLAHPEARDEVASGQVLEQAGIDIRREAGRVELSWKLEKLPRWAAIGLLTVAAAVTLVPFPCGLVLLLTLTSAGVRRTLADLWRDARGVGAARRVVVLSAGALSVKTERGGEGAVELTVEGRDLLGVTFSPTLGYDGDIVRHAGSLRFVGRGRTVTLNLDRFEKLGGSFRDFLVATTLRLREARPDLGLLGKGPRPSHCPFCSALYVMGPGTRCPNCGAASGVAMTV